MPGGNSPRAGRAAAWGKSRSASERESNSHDTTPSTCCPRKPCPGTTNRSLTAPRHDLRRCFRPPLSYRPSSPASISESVHGEPSSVRFPPDVGGGRGRSIDTFRREHFARDGWTSIGSGKGGWKAVAVRLIESRPTAQPHSGSVAAPVAARRRRFGAIRCDAVRNENRRRRIGRASQVVGGCSVVRWRATWCDAIRKHAQEDSNLRPAD